tara:strand:+ start:349 stop:540 length:192 start_codon:yes stop_codon:yes gene_type:complete
MEQINMHLEYLNIADLDLSDLNFYVRDLEGHIDDFKMMRKWHLVRECEAEKKLLQARQVKLSR